MNYIYEKKLTLKLYLRKNLYYKCFFFILIFNNQNIILFLIQVIHILNHIFSQEHNMKEY
jgi:hypothetical protein